MTDILGYEFETDEELQELIEEGDLVRVTDMRDDDLYDMIINNVEEAQMADIIYYMIETNSLHGALETMGIIEKFNGETYIDCVYASQ